MELPNKYKIELGTPVVVNFSDKHSKLYDFGYYSHNKDNVIVYNHNKRNKNNSVVIEATKVKKATNKDLKELDWD